MNYRVETIAKTSSKLLVLETLSINNTNMKKKKKKIMTTLFVAAHSSKQVSESKPIRNPKLK